jgi:thymidylate kinase
MKIAFSGPSGLGKSTLCKFISEELPSVKWLSTSAGDILGKEEKKRLKDEYGYSGTGHRNVINLSSIDPLFGYDFQLSVLEARKKQIEENDNFVIDRCPIDNVAYLLAQNSHNLEEATISTFIKEAQEAYCMLDYVIQIRFSNDIPKIEDNDSRIPNRFFQQYISDVFSGVYARYFANLVGPSVITIDFWDLTERKGLVANYFSAFKRQ